MAATGQEALKFDQNTAFGSAGNYMREILGYVPIEPDGSVRVSVPSDVAFQIDVVDAQVSAGAATGYIWREFPLHRSWLQLLPGEELDCNGCHLPASQQRSPAGVSSYSHNANPPLGSATPDLFASIWGGAIAAGPFPGTTSGTRRLPGRSDHGRGACRLRAAGQRDRQPDGDRATLSVNVEFTDPWFGGGHAGNESINLSYDDPTFTTPLPTPTDCALSGGDGGDDCRIVINYPTTPPATATVAVAGNIEPLWDKDRPVGGVDGAGTCSGCHNASTAATGYLDLADGASNTNANQENSYQQLMNPFSITTVDPTTGQTTTTQVRGAEFISGDAADSHFFQVFTNPANPDYASHAGLISPAEMRLLSEWVDIGAQYFNNPFNAPVELNSRSCSPSPWHRWLRCRCGLRAHCCSCS